MKHRFLDIVEAVKSGQPNTSTKPIPAGSYSGIQVTITGSTVATETLGLDDLGYVSIEHAEKGQLIRADMGFLNSYTEITGGYPAKPSGTAESAERVSFVIPFGVDPFPNVLQLLDDRTASIKFEFGSAMATRFGSNAVTARVDLMEQKDIAQTYFLKLQTQNQQAQSAGSITDTITGRNLVQMFLRDSAGVVDKLSLQVDNEQVVDNTPIGVLRDYTNIVNRVEADGQPWVEIAIANNPVKEMTENRSASIVTDFTGAGTMQLNKFNFEWLPSSERDQNIQRVDARLRAKTNN